MTIESHPRRATQRAFGSAVTALGVAVAITALLLLRTGIWLAVALQVPSGDMVASVLGSALLTAVPFGIGFFVCLWIVAPITAQLTIGHVITRAALATVFGAIAVFVTTALLAVLGAFGVAGPLFGNSLGGFFDAGTAQFGLSQALNGGLGALVEQLALGVLAGVLLWLWMTGQRPRHPVESVDREAGSGV
ncbi:hypothetical protein BH11ACT4_BH11ACT4_10610 [soil metagenome]